MSIRTTAGNAVQDVLPTTPLIGPPLPSGLKINWPRMFIRYTRGVTSPMSQVYDPVKRTVVKAVRGY
jgi:hypothetical protein